MCNFMKFPFMPIYSSVRFIETPSYLTQEQKTSGPFPYHSAWTLQGGKNGNFVTRFLARNLRAISPNTNVSQ